MEWRVLLVWVYKKALKQQMKQERIVVKPVVYGVAAERQYDGGEGGERFKAARKGRGREEGEREAREDLLFVLKMLKD
jgi:hypothetical protein